MGSKILSVISGIILPPISAFLVNVIPLFVGGTLRGDSGLLILLPFVYGSLGISGIPFWLIASLTINSLLTPGTKTNGLKLSVISIIIPILTALFIFGYKSKTETAFSFIRDKNIAGLKSSIENGLNPNMVDKQGISLLHYAVFNNSADAIEILLNAGADADYKSPFGDSALSYVDSNSSDNHIFDLILRHSKKVHEDYKSYWNAITSGRTDRVKKLINAGQKFHLIYGEASIRECIDKKNINLLKLLLDSSADPNSFEEYSGRTVLMLAAGAGNYHAVKILLDAGADSSTADKRGDTALKYAEYSNRQEVLDLLKPTK